MTGVHSFPCINQAALSLISDDGERQISPLVMNDGMNCHDPRTIELLLCSLFETSELCGTQREILRALVARGGFRSHLEVVLGVRDFVVHSMNAAGVMTAEGLDILRRTVTHIEETLANSRAYSTEGRSNPDAVFWPNPTYEKSPRSVHDELPWGETYGFVAKDTPIGSAGSCFAMEIAHRLQDEGYNYVITEPHTLCDNSGKGYPDASAAWGIIFNIPSLRQLVEKAFGIRKLPKLLWQAGPADFRDPFREDIIFSSPDEYNRKHQSHLDACREALTKCKVFVATFGLNEVWELKSDRSVFSRAPWGISPSLVRRRILTVEENVSELQRMLDVWRTFNPDLKLIVTVSPVPLHATFRGDKTHVVVANSHAKAVLRVAAEEFVSRNRDVYLFPSFETVMYCTKEPWAADQRHVSREAVANVMRLFTKMFLRPE